MSLSQELEDFLQEVETVLTTIPTDLEDTRVDLDRVLMSAEWQTTKQSLGNCRGTGEIVLLIYKAVVSNEGQSSEKLCS